MTGIAQPPTMRGPIDTSWHARGACRKEDPELFYHPDGETGTAKARRISEARAVCNECPVLAICRRETIHEQFGIWGGLSEDERTAIRSGKPVGHTKELIIRPVYFQATKKQRTLDIAVVVGHLNKLIEAGFTPFAISSFAGVSAETVRSLLKATGREIYISTAEKLLSVQVQDVAA